MKTLGMNLKKARNDIDLSAEALAEKLGMTKVSVFRWESGARNPDLATLLKIAKILGTTVGSLLGETVPEPQQPPTYAQLPVEVPMHQEPQSRKDTPLTMDDASVPLILEYLNCRLRRDREEMTSEELNEALEKLYKCADYLANGQQKARTA